MMLSNDIGYHNLCIRQGVQECLDNQFACMRVKVLVNNAILDIALWGRLICLTYPK